VKISNRMKKYLVSFVFIPLLFNLILIGCYFSGIDFLQQIIAPTVEGLASNAWREFGLLEQLQNLLLLAVVVILALSTKNMNSVLDRALLIGATLAFLFLFLEEIDYGIHYYELFIGENTGIEVRNWHNQKTNGEQNVKKLKQLVDVLMFLLFIVLPLVKNKISVPFIQNIAPSRWFIAGFAVSLSCSNFAHFLDDQGLGIIAMQEGNLTGNISEFRELSNYYFFMLYALQLHKLESLFRRNR